MKKILALIMALALVMGLAVTASAAKITITPAPVPEGGTASDPVYTAYKILDASLSGPLGTNPDEAPNTTTPVTYTIDKSSPYKTVLAKYFDFEDVPGDATKQVAKKKVNFDAAALAADLAPVLTGETGTATKVDGKFVIDNLDPGYYVITSSVGGNMIVDTLDEVTIESKNAYPTLEKKVNGEKSITADMGAPLTFTIVVTIPKGASGEIVVHDKLTGISYDQITTEDGILAETGTDGCSFHFVLTEEFVEENRGKDITLTYTGKLRDSVPGTNEAWLVYGNFTSKHDIVTVDTACLKIFKYDANDKTNTLKDAQFTLSKVVDGKTYYFSYTDNTMRSVEWTEDKTKAHIAWTGVDGVDYFNGLADGTYTLTEVAAPNGYNLLTEPVEVPISAAAPDETSTSGHKFIVVEVPNSTGSELPSTGGIGTTLFYVVGALMMTGAAVLMITKKRMSV